MVNIAYKLDKGNTFISVTGHANYAEYGKDIVCSGISAITQTSLLGLKEIAKAYPDNVTMEELETSYVMLTRKRYDELCKDSELLQKAINRRFD